MNHSTVMSRPVSRFKAGSRRRRKGGGGGRGQGGGVLKLHPVYSSRNFPQRAPRPRRSRALACRAKVVYDGVDIVTPKGDVAGITASEALALLGSLQRNAKKIRRNARLWGEGR